AAPGFKQVYYGVVTALVSAIAVRLIAYFADGGDIVSRLFVGSAIGITAGAGISLAGLLRFRSVPVGLAAAKPLVLAAAAVQAVGLVAAAGYTAFRLGATA